MSRTNDAISAAQARLAAPQSPDPNVKDRVQETSTLLERIALLEEQLRRLVATQDQRWNLTQAEKDAQDVIDAQQNALISALTTREGERVSAFNAATVNVTNQAAVTGLGPDVSLDIPAGGALVGVVAQVEMLGFGSADGMNYGVSGIPGTSVTMPLIFTGTNTIFKQYVTVPGSQLGTEFANGAAVGNPAGMIVFWATGSTTVNLASVYGTNNLAGVNVKQAKNRRLSAVLL